MSKPISDIAFTPAVKAVQERLGSRRGYANMEERGGWAARISDDLVAFIAERDSAYLGTSSGEGQPYIQHRGGAPGFIKVLDDRTLAFADYVGNRQFISTGNLEENDKAFLFLMDYRHRRRIKIWGRAEFVEDAEVLTRVTGPGDPRDTRRAVVFHVEAWDSNCPQHIPMLYSEAEVEARERALNERIIALQEENDTLQARARSRTPPVGTQP